MNRIGVHESDLEAEEPLARRGVDQLGALLGELGERRRDVVHLVRQMMQSGSALRDELPHGRVVAEGREQLDPTVTDPNRRGLDPLALHAGAVLEAAGEEALVRLHRFVEIRDGDADVVDASCFHPGDASRWRSGKA